jgi:molybdopterin molybdotransferase
MLTATAATKIILRHVRPLSSEGVLLSEALARSLSEDVRSRENVPAFDRSSMDGFAVAAVSLRAASRRKPVCLTLAGESRAGKFYAGQLKADATIRIMTGAMLPRGADAVVPLELVKELKEGSVEFCLPVTRGENVRYAGEDVRRGEKIGRRGDSLTPGMLGVLASIGMNRVRVFKRPVVAILSTGDELVPVTEKPQAGMIRDSATETLIGYARTTGCATVRLGMAGDRRNALRRAIQRGLRADILIVCGGVSVGKYDLVRNVLEELHVSLKIRGVNIKPGKPLVFGTKGRALVFGLPGNPVSSAVTFLKFVKPAIVRMSGGDPHSRLPLTALLDHPISKKDGKRHFLRGIVTSRQGILHVVTTGTQSSGALTSIARANCLIVIPEKVKTLRRGDAVGIELL